MFEGIVNLQLPFMLISSGVSSLLYLIFLFINMGHPKPEQISQDNHTITIEENNEVSSDTTDDFQFADYFQKDIHDTQTLQVDDSFSLRFTKIRHCKLKHTYSMHFAGASFSRPPPIA